MINRIFATAALLALAAAPVFANGAHVDRGASRNGEPADAFFGTPFTGANGVTEITYDNTLTTVNPLIDVFQIPSNFATGTSYTMTFTNVLPVDLDAVYGIFDCDNGTGGAVDASGNDLPGGSNCTHENAGDGDKFVNFVENDATKTVTISFIGGQGTPPPSFYFWTTPGNLLNLSAASTTGGGTGVPEPATYAMLGAGLLGLSLMRRRAVQA
jgi:hypothetical protein